METKQTAVEWIESKLNSVKPIDFCSLQDVKDWVKEAKQMEKEQIKDAFTDGCIGELYELNAYYTSEKYYNETYAK